VTALPLHRSVTWGCLAVLALAGLAACDDGTGASAQVCRNGMHAFAAATDFARGRLALPPLMEDPGQGVNVPGGRTEYLGDCRHKVTSHVERRGPDGAVLDDRFEAVVRFRGSEWELESVAFY